MDPKLAALMAKRKQKQEDDGDDGFYMQNDDPPPQAQANNKERALSVRGKESLSLRRALQVVGALTITADFSFASQTRPRNRSPARRVLVLGPRA